MEIFKLSKRRLDFQPAPGRQRLPFEMSAELSPNPTCCVVVIMEICGIIVSAELETPNVIHGHVLKLRVICARNFKMWHMCRVL